MFIRIVIDIAYSFPQPTEMILMLYTHPSRAAFLMTPERLRGAPALVIEDFIDVYGKQVRAGFRSRRTVTFKKRCHHGRRRSAGHPDTQCASAQYS
jgi:hypothetical protein